MVRAVLRRVGRPFRLPVVPLPCPEACPAVLVAVVGLCALVIGCAPRPPSVVLTHGPPCPEARGGDAIIEGGAFTVPLPTAPPGTTLVYGWVRPRDRSREIGHAQVVVPGTSFGTLADGYGRYVLEIPDELEGALEFSRIGYVTESLPLDLVRSSGRVDVELSTCPVYLS